MAVIKKGITAAKLLPDLSFIPNVGIRQRPREIYADYQEAIAKAQTYFASGMRADVEQVGDSPLWTVRAQIEGDPGDPNSDIQNTHERRVNVLNPDLKANLYLQSQFTTGTAARTISLVENLANKIKSAEDASLAYTQALASITTNVTSADRGHAQLLLDEILLGGEEFIDFQYVYTHTFNFGTITDLTADDSNVRCIFTTAELYAAESIPTEFVLPDGEWMKLPPEETDMVGGRVLLKYEYWWAEQWSALRYARAT